MFKLTSKIVCALFLLLITALTVFFLSCNRNKQENSFTVLDSTISYRLLSFSSESEVERKIKKDDYVLLNLSFLKQNDSIFWDSRYFCPQGYFFKNSNSIAQASFQKYVSEFSLGDSIQFIVKSNSFFLNYFKLTSIPNFCQNDSVVKVNVKIERVFDSNDSIVYFQYVENRLDSLKRVEKTKISNRVNQISKNAIVIDSSIYLVKSRFTNDSLVKNGKIVTISYRGYFLDGKLVDYIPENKSFEWHVGEKDQLLPGLQMALFYLRKGEKAKIILPSRFAFGENGSSGGMIPPFTPLEYEIEVLNLN